MIRRTLYFGNAAYLKTSNRQLIVDRPGTEIQATVPLEDIGLVVLDHQQITITQATLAAMMEENIALISCDNTHHPAGMFLNLEGNTLQSQKSKLQVEASLPLKKNLWQQTVQAKITNQAALLKQIRGQSLYMENLVGKVKTGDSTNCEGQAASYYWKNLFGKEFQFTRERFGPPPNALLNYGYAIVRAMVARALVGSGLIPTLGIFHRNQYNAFCLADDIMEPYRPFVDKLVARIILLDPTNIDLNFNVKQQLLSLPTMDVKMDNRRSPMLVAISRTTAGLVKCLEGKQRKMLYPSMC